MSQPCDFHSPPPPPTTPKSQFQSQSHHLATASTAAFLPDSPTAIIFPDSPTTSTGFRIQRCHQKPRRKRPRVLRLDPPPPTLAVPKPGRKPDPAAPKITRPCTECGKKFWSWKALFGHMRCHPERQWRGINPPPNFLQPPTTSPLAVTEEDHEVAASLLLLANGPPATPPAALLLDSDDASVRESVDGGCDSDDLGLLNGRFECSSCNKVFVSHQALGGHRASHKNVKGCFASTRIDCGDNGDTGVLHGGEDVSASSAAADGEISAAMGMMGHKCSICLKVFPSGQALGGHKRCHRERGEEQPQPPGVMTSLLTQFRVGDQIRSLFEQPRPPPPPPPPPPPKEPCSGQLDLNFPAPAGEEDCNFSNYASSGLVLDLRLGI